MINERLLYILLTIVKKNGDVRQMLKEGVSFKEIGDLINTGLELKLLVFVDDEIKLTTAGKTKINKEWVNFKSTNKADWILPDVKNKISKMGKNDIYLPNERELTF
ncbi:hypothetical protein [Pedobacter sp. UC225_65]|uniref:hypothetical protein n=1 Tax=Pedobacter sp. UC225_65 TaxID=3350173 RepID=UPI00367350A1